MSIPLDVFAGPIEVWAVRASNFFQMLDTSAGRVDFALTNAEEIAPAHGVTGTQWLVSAAQFVAAATPSRVLSRLKTNGSAKMTDGVRLV